MISFAKRRLSEPSTWAGIGLLLTQAAQAWASKDPVAIAGVLGGVVAMVKPDAK